jgi:hypothetical protein
MYYFKAVVFAVAVVWEGGNGHVVMTYGIVPLAFSRVGSFGQAAGQNATSMSP